MAKPDRFPNRTPTSARGEAARISFSNDPLQHADGELRKSSAVQNRLSLRFGKRVWRIIGAIFLFGFVGGSVCLIIGQDVLGMSLIGLGVLVWFIVPVWIFGVVVFALVRGAYRKLTGRSVKPPAPSPAMTPLGQEAAKVARELDGIRKQFLLQRRVRLRFAMPLGLAIGACAAWQVYISNQGNYIPTTLVFLLTVAIAYAVATVSIEAKYAAAFKQRMLPLLLSRHGKVEATSQANPDLARAQLTGVLWRHDTLTVDDGFIGIYRDYPLEIYELKLWRRGVGKYGNRNKRGTTRRCLAIAIALDRPVKATTAVIDRHGFDEGAVSHDDQLQAVTLEDPVFDMIYSVRSTDELGARVLLTPAIMSRMLSMADNTSFLPPSLLADGKRLIFVLQFHGAISLFEPPSVAREMEQHITTIDGELNQIFGMVDTMIAMAEGMAGRRIPVT